jgi:predicted enzyme related to lactoylglutathione lyase
MASRVCHIEYQTEDLAASRRFCEQAFEWEFKAFGDSMIVFGTPEGHIGGFVKGGRPEAKSSPEVCYKVDSLDQFVKNAEALGACLENPKKEVPGVGWYASILAPDGNVFGLVEFTDQG